MADAKRVIEVVIKGRNDLSTIIKSTNKDLASLQNVAKGVGTGLLVAGTAIGTAMGAAVASTAKFGEELVTLRGRTGLTAETLSELKFVAEQNETSLQGLATGFRFLAKNAYDAQQGGAETTAAFKALGVTVTDAEGRIRPLRDLFTETATGLQSIKNDAERTAITLKVFGRGGTELANVLKLTGAEFNALTAEAHRLGLVMDDTAADAADKFGDSIEATKASLNGLVRTVATQALPRLQEYVAAVQGAVVKAGEWAKANPQTGGSIVSLVEKLIGAGGLLVALASVGKVIEFVKTGVTVLGITLSGGTLAALVAFTAAMWTLHDATKNAVEEQAKLAKGSAPDATKVEGGKPAQADGSIPFPVDPRDRLFPPRAASEIASGAKATETLAEAIERLGKAIDTAKAPEKLRELTEELRRLQRSTREAFIEDFNVERPDVELKPGPRQEERDRIAARPPFEDPLKLDLVDPWLEKSEEAIGEFTQIGVDAVSSVGNALGSALGNAITGAQQQFSSLGDFLRSMFAEVAASAAAAFAKLGIGSLLGGLFPGSELIAKLFPKFETGGFVPKTGPAIVHAGEFVIPKAAVDAARSESRTERSTTRRAGPSAPMTQNVTVNMGLMFGGRVETLEAARRLKQALNELDYGFAR